MWHLQEGVYVQARVGFWFFDVTLVFVNISVSTCSIRRHSHRVHNVELSDEQLAAMFLKKFGYPSRYDAFSLSNNSLEITDITAEDIEMELEEYGLKFDDIVKDLFEENGMINCF